MEQLHLIIPNLFPPQDIAQEVCSGLRVPLLEKMLSRAALRVTSTMSLEDRLCNEYHVQAVAPVRAAFDGIVVGDDYWMCADPVNLQLQRAQMLLIPDVNVSQDAADVLCSMLNEHFAGMGMRFIAPNPHHWYLQLETEPQLTTSPLQQVAWRDAKFYQPQGADTLRWQSIITEIQMLLYAHSLNQEREARGELTVGSLWLWGGGRAKPLKSPYVANGGDSYLARAFAQIAGVAQIESLSAMLEVDLGCGLWVCTALQESLQRGDLYAWRTEVEKIEKEFALPIFNALRLGQLRSLKLEVLLESGSKCFDLTPADSFKLWRFNRPLADHAV